MSMTSSWTPANTHSMSSLADIGKPENTSEMSLLGFVIHCEIWKRLDGM